MSYSQFDYTLANDLARETARAQRRFEREVKRQEEEIRRAIAPEAPIPFIVRFKIAPVRLESRK
jgi:hypothetical protein